MKLKRILATVSAVLLMGTVSACDSKSGSSPDSKTNSDGSAEIETDAPVESTEPVVSGETITWLCEYDLNPSGDDSRSVALTLFEDLYGGKVEWVPTTNETKFDDLANRILNGEPVDMLPYEPAAVPDGIYKKQYQPLDNYVDLDDELWSDFKEIADKMMYNGEHYVIPYKITDPMCITYSRKLVKDEKLDDPYELYQQGKWDWDAFMSMMNTFVENAEGDETRYGCTGRLGQAMVQSTGQTFVTYDGTVFKNNIMNEDIEKAELLIEEIKQNDLYDYSWHSYFPDDGSTLFYSMPPWALAESNGMNPDEDIFIVPFPKSPNSDEYYLCADYAAKMLAANSDKGEAVAEYIKCERIAASNEKYVAAAKEKALTPEVNAKGEKVKYITEEQWDIWQSLTDPANVTPVFDFGYGMGAKMSSETYDYETRGAMQNLSDAMITQYEGSPDTWEELRDEWKEVIDEEIAKFN